MVRMKAHPDRHRLHSLRAPARRSPGTHLLVCMFLASLAGQIAHAAKRTDAQPKPVATIAAAPLGFRPPGEIYLLGRLSSTTLDFVDNSHLLFTFHESRLMQREREVFHDDQNIRAIVLNIASGKTEATADWRMHDRLRYLLPTGDGTFLVRQGSQIQRTDRSLALHPYLKFDERLLSVELSPDRQLLVAQSDLERHSAEAHKRLVEEALLAGESLPDEDVGIRMIRLNDRSVVASAKTDNPIKLAVASSGYIMHEPQKGGRQADAWQIDYIPFSGEKKRLLDLHSACRPSEEFLNEDTLLITSCTSKSADRQGRAVTLAGKELWSGVWDARLVWPTFYRSVSGSTFALEWIRVTHPVDSFDPINDSDVEAQVVQVLSTTTGHLLLTTIASPVISAGQNFALSPDGTRFAVLNHDNIEVYDVPADTQ